MIERFTLKLLTEAITSKVGQGIHAAGVDCNYCILEVVVLIIKHLRKKPYFGHKLHKNISNVIHKL